MLGPLGTPTEPTPPHEHKVSPDEEQGFLIKGPLPVTPLSKSERAKQAIANGFQSVKDCCSSIGTGLSKCFKKSDAKIIGEVLKSNALTTRDVETLMQCETGRNELELICNERRMPENYQFFKAFQTFKRVKTPEDRLYMYQHLQHLLREKLNDNIYGDVYSSDASRGMALKNSLLEERSEDDFRDQANFQFRIEQLELINSKLEKDVASQLVQREIPALWDKYQAYIPK